MRRQAVRGLALLLAAACLLYISQGAHVEQVSIEHCAGPGSSRPAAAAELQQQFHACCCEAAGRLPSFPPVSEVAAQPWSHQYVTTSACVTLPLLPEPCPPWPGPDMGVHPLLEKSAVLTCAQARQTCIIAVGAPGSRALGM
jgi:hypothetical protein